MPFFIPALLAGASLIGGALGNRDKKTSQTSQTDSTTTTDQYTRPEYDAFQTIMKDRISNEYLRLLDSGGAEAADAITRNSVYNINRNADLAGATAANFARSRGLGRTTVGSVPAASVFANRAFAVADAENQNPLLRRQFEQENLGNFAQFFSSLPVGSHTTGTQRTQGTQNTQGVQQGNPWGGAVGNLAGTLAGLYGMGAFGKVGGSPAPAAAPTPWTNPAPASLYNFRLPGTPQFQ